MKYWETAVQVHSIGQTTKFHPQTQKLMEQKKAFIMESSYTMMKSLNNCSRVFL